MCFAKSAPVVVAPSDPVVRDEADANLTKNSKNFNATSGYQENIKTTPIGLEDSANTKKKTLLGE